MFDELTSGLATLGKRFSPTAEPVAVTDSEQPAAAPTASALPVWTIVRQAGLLWLATRAAFAIFTYVAVPFNGQNVHGPPNTRSYPPHVLIDQWNRWDTQWYTGIAINGYHDIYTTAFFPFYPFLIHLGIIVTGAAHAATVALVISNLATLAAFIAIGLLAALEYGPAFSPFGIRALAAFPLAFFLAGGYSDSVFLAFAAFGLLCARRGLWYWAAGCAALATLTRLFGLVLILPLLWEWIGQYRLAHPGPWRVPSLRGVAEFASLALAVPLALLFWAIYLDVKVGDPFSYFTVQRKYWNHYAVGPWQWFQSAHDTLARLPGWSYPQVRVLFDLAPVIAVLLLTIIAFRSLPLSFGLYMLGTLFICLTSSVPLNFDPFTGQGRYMLMSVPIFLLLGRWMARRPGLDLFIVSAGFMLQGLFTAIFLRGGWLV
jgi:hypothetical protein